MDYNYHTKYFFHFSKDFNDAYNKFGLQQESSSVRNSPVFYMFFSIFLKLGLTLKNLKIINILILFPLLFFFVKCLEIKYSNIDIKTKIYFSSALLLSPTIRTMIVWPYPLLWALCFFLISLYFFLVFKKTKFFNHKINLAYYNVFFLSLSAYFTPNFAFFSIFFLYNFYKTFNLQKEIFKIILFNLILAAPAVYFLITKDFYLFNSEVYKIDASVKYNLSNKIIIISSMLLLFFLPFISKRNFFNNYSKIKINFSLFVLLFFIFINIYFYNFLPNAGGGIFYHLSHYLVKNSSILFITFFFTLYLFRHFNLYNLNNVFLFVILVFYNLQFTIYYKYFDPLMFFLFLFLVKFNHKIDIKIDILSKKYLLFYIIFLAMNYSKSFINY